MNWGEVALVLGTTEVLCERCGENEQEVLVKTPSDKKRHGLCKECLGIIVEIGLN